MISDYDFHANESLFFDTNIWIFIDGPSTNWSPYMDKRYDQYSAMLKNAQKCNATIYINETVAGEYVNQFIRIEMREDSVDSKSDKNYRQKEDYNFIVHNAISHLKDNLSRSTKIDTDFCNRDLREMEEWMINRKCDYNDAMIARFCIDNDFTLVTDDQDYKMFDKRQILTANPKLVN